jgi:hypothetical protein
VYLLLVHTFKYSILFASFVDRDMMMLHFGSGIGHVNSATCRQSDEDLGSESGSESEAGQASVSENMDISEEDDSDSESSKSDAPSMDSSGSDDDGLSESDDDGYASF